MSGEFPIRICETCRKVLDIRATAFGVTYEHTIQDKDDHPVIPVIPPEGWSQGRCDFCNADHPEYVLPVRDFTAPVPDLVNEHTSVGDWAACRRCADLIRLGNWLALERQAIGRLQDLAPVKLTSKEKEPIRKLYRMIRQNVTGPLRPI